MKHFRLEHTSYVREGGKIVKTPAGLDTVRYMTYTARILGLVVRATQFPATDTKAAEFVVHFLGLHLFIQGHLHEERDNVLYFMMLHARRHLDQLSVA